MKRAKWISGHGTTTRELATPKFRVEGEREISENTSFRAGNQEDASMDAAICE